MLTKISYDNSEIAIHTYGNGASVLVALHGYGESGASFSMLAPYLDSSFTMLCPDLPFHGETKWPAGKTFSIDDIYNILDAVVPLSLRRITLVGYSMGGRMALAFAQAHPTLVEKLVLLAPDGLHKNFWYWFSTQNRIGNKLFSYTMQNPHWVFKWMNTAKQLGLLNKSIFKFVHHYLDDAQEREDLYERWTAFRFIKPSVSKLAAEKRFRTVLIYGRYDRIISAEKGKVLARTNECITVKMIHSGHQLLAEKHARAIAALCMRES